MLTEEMAGCLSTIDIVSIPRSVMLCGTCTTVISRIQSSFPGSHDGPRPQLFAYASREDTWRGAHHTEDGTFASAVDNRCYVCHTLHEACPKKARKHANLARSFYEIEPQKNDRYLLRFAIEIPPAPSNPTPQLIETYGNFKLLPSKLLPYIGPPLGLTKDTFSDQCKAQITEWLDDCEANHRMCMEDWRTKLEYPARLLNVDPRLGHLVRLEANIEKENHPRYVTMSHCWNHDPGVHLTKLTAANEEDLRGGFEISRLPQKFQHAIRIAQWMKIDYLWIDALCIMQGSAEDWKEQSSIMGDIYAGSYCNIAATSADEKEGCFRERHTEVVEPYLLRDSKILSGFGTYMLGYDDFWCNSLLDTDLHTRAWVLQERLLSPRTIHFGKEQMFWECRKHKACEAYPKGVPSEFSNRRTEAWRLGEQMFNPKSKTFASQSLLDRAISWVWSWKFVPSKQAYKFWSTAVEWYMDCNLTESSDKLVAIAGIANKVRETTGERYLAGLWENSSLAQSLLWFVPIRNQADGRPSVRYPSFGCVGYRAPSWSWASVDGRIIWTWPADSDEILLSIDHTDVKIPGDDLSTIESAEMHVNGRLVAVNLSIMHKNDDGSPKEDGSYTLNPTEETVAAQGAVVLPGGATHDEPLIYLDTPLFPRSSIKAYLVPVCRRGRDRNGNVVAEINGLIVKKLASTDTKYERVGVFGLQRSQAHLVEGLYSRFSSRLRNTQQFILV